MLVLLDDPNKTDRCKQANCKGNMSEWQLTKNDRSMTRECNTCGYTEEWHSNFV